NIAQGLIATSEFNVANNTAYFLGDRNDDSDEFDDAVIVHEYAHLLAAKFSRDDSPGGPHVLGDMLDPRVAWSEGWANFFSSAVRNDPIWRDSYGLNGTRILRYDLEDNVPAGDKPGYWSEASVDTILWDFFGDHPDPADEVQLHYPFSAIWNAFTDLRNDLFLMDVNGRVIDKSDSGLNGQSERIALKVSPGAYVVEIRSFYTKAETGGFIFNSGQYRLSVSVQ